MTHSLYRITVREDRSGSSWTLFLRSECAEDAQVTALHALFYREGSGRYVAAEPTVIEEATA